jgi:hypothetical protein
MVILVSTLGKEGGSESAPPAELAPVWEHDKEADSCRLCGTSFTVIRRRVTYMTIGYIVTLRVASL